MHLQAGAVFAGYTIERVLGVGGMGVVYLARHPRLSRRVALKVLNESLAADPAARAAFDIEAELAAGLEHPNIVPVEDRSSPGDPTLWLAIRYVEGGDLSALMATFPRGLSPERAVRLITDAAHALDFAHHRHVLHRDVKSANLLLGHDARHGERALLTDFGIARALDGPHTSTGVSATLAYVAPERFSSRPTDHRADQYSLGCTFYHLLTGQHPFAGRDEAAMIAAHLYEAPPDPRRIRPDLPGELGTVFATVLAKDPADRYPNCVAFAEAAARAVQPAAPTVVTAPQFAHPSTAPIADGLAPKPKGTTRRRLLIGGAIAIPVMAATAAFTLPTLFEDEPTVFFRPALHPLTEGGRVLAVASSPDGTLLATGSSDNDVRLWNARTGEPARAPMEGHTDYVWSVAFSPDGTLLATGGDDRTIRVWNGRTGEWLKTLQGHDDYVSSVAFSPDGTRLVSAACDKDVRLWHVDSGQLDRRLTGHTEKVRAAAFSPDGNTVVSGGDDKTIRVWNANSGELEMPRLTGHTGGVRTLAFSPDGSVFATGSNDKTIRIWNARTGEPDRTLSGHTDAVLSLAFSPDGTRLASGSSDKTVRTWNVSTGEPERPPLTGHTSPVNSVAYRDNISIATGDDDAAQFWVL
ncbi:WD40 repeat domain-containing serine/threonine protein kinase [Nocardia sp. NPDC058658]|uniref:WD40 repeat domain-containing serine/threonine protein kinase n=1 Tax=Nocardia sp. NPDC058658 TaxID=3346580 RepID=UPI00365D5EA2